MEALEAGAIPVTIKMKGLDYLRYVFGDHPFIVAKNWEEASCLVKSLLIDPVSLELQREAVVSWYRDFTERLSDDLITLARGYSSTLSSEQFRYQKRSRWNPRVRSIVWLHFRWPSLASRLRRPFDGVYRTWTSIFSCSQ